MNRTVNLNSITALNGQLQLLIFACEHQVAFRKISIEVGEGSLQVVPRYNSLPFVEAIT